MMVFLVHVRDPQFYALPSRTRAKNGRIRVMGFPPIGIMSLSIEGEREENKKAIAWLEKTGIKVEPVEINTIEG